MRGRPGAIDPSARIERFPRESSDSGVPSTGSRQRPARAFVAAMEDGGFPTTSDPASAHNISLTLSGGGQGAENTRGPQGAPTWGQ